MLGHILIIEKLHKISKFLTEMQMAWSISDAIGNGHTQFNGIGNEIFLMKYATKHSVVN